MARIFNNIRKNIKYQSVISVVAMSKIPGFYTFVARNRGVGIIPDDEWV
jgi:hypothetical protein